MFWAMALRPLGSLLLFGLAALVAYKVLGPLIPDGRFKTLLFDRSIRQNHPWKFGIGALIACYGVVAAIGWYVYS